MDDDMFDTSELTRLADDLGRIPGRLFPKVAAVVTEHGAGLAKDWAANARLTTGKHAKRYPETITSEVRFRPGFTSDITAEVGPEFRRQGKLGRLLEYGSPTSPPHLDGNRAADAREVPFAADLSRVVEEGFG